ncbi:hypothetical protein [Nocardioides alcanivorans]|uniref:hypothetical protein n=1 Tax=Nocardioides alcanivorans TaxID=2897352 RepID=UPI001F3DA3FF|nr:hypothetical protein [Nocardioides alcanivorans]
MSDDTFSEAGATGRGQGMSGTTYEIRVEGAMPVDLLSDLGPSLVATHELRTVMTGEFTDQAELHGLLRRIRALGLELVEIRAAYLVTDEPSGDGS